MMVFTHYKKKGKNTIKQTDNTLKYNYTGNFMGNKT